VRHRLSLGASPEATVGEADCSTLDILTASGHGVPQLVIDNPPLGHGDTLPLFLWSVALVHRAVAIALASLVPDVDSVVILAMEHCLDCARDPSQ
jgi:hypothetical protein